MDTFKESVRGGFGSGKSHLLACFEHAGLKQGYAVRRVFASKETPLQMLPKVLASAVENIRVPNAVGRGLDEVALLNERPDMRSKAETLRPGSSRSAKAPHSEPLQNLLDGLQPRLRRTHGSSFFSQLVVMPLTASFSSILNFASYCRESRTGPQFAQEG